MFSDFHDYPWVLPLCRYGTVDELLGMIGESVIRPAETLATQIAARRATLLSSGVIDPTTSPPNKTLERPRGRRRAAQRG